MRHLQMTYHRFATLSRALLLGALLALAGPLQANSPAEFTEGELEQILAPIALYPDTVLSHILIAATYPLEVVQAARWSRANPDLKGEEALNAAESQGWDPSVTALTAFPQLLERMDEDLGWTQDLGEAFLLDEGRVIDTIQTLRQMAYDSGHLNQMEHLTVEREAETIIIEPAVREVVYVPYYDTRVVYGHWYWTNYPPMYWYYPGGYYTTSYVYWGHGVRVSPRFYFSTVYWPHRHVVIVDRSYPRYRGSRQIVHYQDSRRWSHNPRHRRGVVYHHQELNRTYNVNRSHSSGHQHQDQRIRGSRRAQDVQISGDRQRNQRHTGGTTSRDSTIRGDRRQSTGGGDSRVRTQSGGGDSRARTQSGGDGQTGGRRVQQRGDSGAESAPTNRRELRQQRRVQPDSSSAAPAPSGDSGTGTRSSAPTRVQSDSSSSTGATSRSSTRSSATTRSSTRSSGASSRSNRSQGSSTRGSRRSN